MFKEHPYPFRDPVILDIFFSEHHIEFTYDFVTSKSMSRGIDKISVDKFNKIKKDAFKLIERKCIAGKYKFAPYLEQLLSKGRGKTPRVISIPTVRDKIVLRILCDILSNYFPNALSRKLPNDYIREIKSYINLSCTPNTRLKKIDVKSFYDSINHDILIEKLYLRIKNEPIKTLLGRAIFNKTVPDDFKKSDYKGVKNSLGVPQGLAISNILADIYLSKDEQGLRNISEFYCRYVDDIIIIYNKDDELKINTEVDSIFKSLKLEYNKDKTTTCSLEDNFEFLGYSFSPGFISVRDSSVQRFIKNTIVLFTRFIRSLEKERIRDDGIPIETIKQVFIEDLNEKITGAISEHKRYGWLFYFSEINDIKLLCKMDRTIKSLFTRLPAFGRRKPPEVKSLRKAYYAVNYDIHGGYIHNYSNYSTTSAKMNYLRRRGLLRNIKKKYFSPQEIDRMFYKIMRRNLSRLDRDIGIIS